MKEELSFAIKDEGTEKTAYAKTGRQERAWELGQQAAQSPVRHWLAPEHGGDDPGPEGNFRGGWTGHVMRGLA